jgi:hypothetical protein
MKHLTITIDGIKIAQSMLILIPENPESRQFSRMPAGTGGGHFEIGVYWKSLLQRVWLLAWRVHV